MINKRRAIPLIVVIFLVCIVLALGLYHVFTSFDIKRSEDTICWIAVVLVRNTYIRHKGFHIKKVARFTGNLFYGFLLSELFRQLGFVAHTIRGSSSSKISKCLDEGSNCRPQVHHFTRSFPEIWKLSS